MRLSAISKASYACIFASFALLILLNKYNFDTLRVGGDLYHDLITGENLVASIQPSPVDIIEAYLEATLLKESPQSLPERQARLMQLKGFFEVGHDYWLKQNIDPTVKGLLTGKSYEPARTFWTLVENEFLPALAIGDLKRADEIYRKMSDAYLENRKWIAETERQASRRNEYLNSSASSAVYSSEIEYFVSAGVVILLIGWSIAVLIYGVLKPLSLIKTVIVSLAEGNLGPVPFVSRRDEVGVVARALEVLRLRASEHASSRESMQAAEEREIAREKLFVDQGKELRSSVQAALKRLREELANLRKESGDFRSTSEGALHGSGKAPAVNYDSASVAAAGPLASEKRRVSATELKDMAARSEQTSDAQCSAGVTSSGIQIDKAVARIAQLALAIRAAAEEQDSLTHAIAGRIACKDRGGSQASSRTSVAGMKDMSETWGARAAISLDAVCQDLSGAMDRFANEVLADPHDTMRTSGLGMSLMVTLIRDGGLTEAPVEEITPNNIRIKPIPGLSIEDSLQVDLGFGPLSARVTSVEAGYIDLALVNRADGIYLSQ